MTFFIVMFVLLIQFLWKWIDELVGKGIDWYVIAELMFYVSATLVPMALPLAVLLSSLMTFGNLGENYELVALKSSGVSLQKSMRPLIIFMIFLSAGAFYFSNNVMPVANLKFKSLLRDIRVQKPSVSIKEGEFYTNISDFVIKIGSKGDDGVSIYNILIYDHRERNGNNNVTIARHGRMEMTEDKKNLVFTLFDGYNYNENMNNNRGSMKAENRPMQKTYFAKDIRRIDLSEFSFTQSDGSSYKNNYRMLNVNQLTYFMDSLQGTQDSTYRSFTQYAEDDFSFMQLYNKIQNDTTGFYLQGDRKANENKSADAQIAAEAQNKAIAAASTARPVNNVRKPVYDARDTFYTFPLDTNLALQDEYLANFSNHDREKIIESALSNARNSSFHTDIVTNNIEAKARLIRKHEIEYHRKFTLSVACLILFFIGAPLGAIIRKGGLGMPVVISILLFVVYHVLSMVGEKSTKELAMSPLVGMWLSNLFFFPVGIFLMYKDTTDAPLLDAESWRKGYQNVIRVLMFWKR